MAQFYLNISILSPGHVTGVFGETHILITTSSENEILLSSDLKLVSQAMDLLLLLI